MAKKIEDLGSEYVEKLKQFAQLREMNINAAFELIKKKEQQFNCQDTESTLEMLLALAEMGNGLMQIASEGGIDITEPTEPPL